MLNFTSLMIFSEDAPKLAEFYNKVFQKQPDWADGGYFGWKVGAAYVSVGPHDKVKGKSAHPERIMMNFETTDVKGEFSRIEKISGAKIIAKPYQMEGMGKDDWIATLADPDGNYFQLMSPFEM